MNNGFPLFPSGAGFCPSTVSHATQENVRCGVPHLAPAFQLRLQNSARADFPRPPHFGKAVESRPPGEKSFKWAWLKNKRPEGQTAGFGSYFHLPGQAILEFRIFEPRPNVQMSPRPCPFPERSCRTRPDGSLIGPLKQKAAPSFGRFSGGKTGKSISLRERFE